MRIVSALAALTLSILLGPAPATALGCEDISFDGQDYTICRVDMEQDDLRLFLDAPDGQPWAQFGRIDAALEATGQRLAFAMNAGMYHADRSPVGLYVENGKERMRAIPNAGPGNFGLLPNGVFCFGSGRAHVIETLTFLKEGPACPYATQSGPMLVIDGELHPRFLEGSDSRYIRNGVGTSSDGRMAIFAISHRPVTFHEFGRLYRDGLGLDQALFLDGNVSKLHAPAIGRSDFGRAMGPIVGVAAPKADDR
ncbi:hypothetical protein OCH239_07550 [Roseivivax halodurans JCM 10272]|uniref:Phosphodiester glycosidase domain-containing protein n=1 Tax=Roseivivax halodurans JCM 10272 TaxID=1449350 RepID=X7EJC6_9RHOB|nr:phosphodiester glycosidase family protein [Roseivivax halodurans]ETX16012.1 hypothetical protein OCH239_07550 [Roseivivax halodurans JCM 10272]